MLVRTVNDEDMCDASGRECQTHGVEHGTVSKGHGWLFTPCNTFQITSSYHVCKLWEHEGPHLCVCGHSWIGGISGGVATDLYLVDSRADKERRQAAESAATHSDQSVGEMLVVEGQDNTADDDQDGDSEKPNGDSTHGERIIVHVKGPLGLRTTR